MISNGLFSKYLSAVIDTNDFENSISKILEMIKYSKSHNTTYYTHEDSVYAGDIEGEDFATWVYDSSDPRLRDIKQELLIEINRAQTLDSKMDLAAFMEAEETFTVGIIDDSKIQDIFDYLRFKQNRLKNITNKSSFAQELQECYYFIYFDVNVSSTLSTLNNAFSSIVNEIVFHLNQLDLFCKECPQRLTEGFSNENFSSEFKKKSCIDCSPQSDRKSVEKLRKNYTNELTGEKELVICELHTKFSKYNRDATKQDRIYFHKGKIGLLEGKLIVIHIGNHA